MNEQRPNARDRQDARQRSYLEREGVPFDLLIDSVRDYAICMLDAQGHVVSWNQGAERIKGYKRDEIVGRHISAFYTPEDVAAGKPQRNLEAARAEGRVEDETWRVRKDGTLFWADVIITALRGEDGQLIGFLKITRDLTARREAEQRLQESEERFRLLVESVKDYAIFMLDPHGYVISWNAGAQRIKGYTADEIIGRHFSAFYPREDIEAGKPEWELEQATKLGRIEDEGWRVRKDGTTFFADVVITAVRDESGTLRGFAKVTRDMTERRVAETERQILLEARIRSEETSRAKDQFLMTLSHELRTPMTSILGWSRLLATGALGDEEQKTAIEAIQQSATVQASLIDDVLDVSRLIAGKLQLKMQAIDPRKIIADTVLTLKPSADARSVEIVADIAPDVEVIAADRDRLRQVIWNLLSNAIKFSQEGQQVVIAARRVESDLEIIVRDEGQGIPPEFLPYVFDPFMQADGSATRAHGGLGLGLTIVRNLVGLHGGTVKAESMGRGQGATFRVRIPVGAVVADGGDGRRGPVRESNIVGARVLFVDDHAPSRLLVKSILTHAGADADVVASVDEALGTLRGVTPDLIITDIAMPGRDGFDLLRSVRHHADRRLRAVPVVAFTAFGRREGQGEFTAWLKKPIEPDDLVAAVATALGRA